MHEFREGDEGFRPSPPPEQHQMGNAELARFEQVGDLHYNGAAYSSSMEYYRSALRAVVPGQREIPGAHAARLHRKIADCQLQQGLPDEAAAELTRAEQTLPDGDVLERAVLRVRRGLVRFRQGRYEESNRLALEGFGHLATSDLHREVGNAQMILGNCAVRLGRPEKAREFFQDALATFRRIDLTLGQAQALSNLAILAKNECRWSRALQLFTRAESIVREQGHTHELAILHNSLAVLYRKMGRRAEAMAQVERGLELGRNLGDQSRLTRLKLLRGQILIEEGKFEDAEESLLEARVLAERRRIGRDLALADEFLGDLMAARGRLQEADLNYQLAEKRALGLGAPNDIQAEVLRRRAELALRKDDLDLALQSAGLGRKVAEACGERFELPYFDLVLGEVHQRRHEHEEARGAMESALELFREYRLPLEVRRCLMALAHLHMEQDGRAGLLLARGRLRETLDTPGAGSEIDSCEVQLELARVELGLSNFDEALLALYELERISCSADDRLRDEVAELRAEIESALTHEAKGASEQYQALADLPDLLDSDGVDASHSLRTMLVALSDRLEAERGFLAVKNAEGRLRVLTTLRLNRKPAHRLGEHVLGLLENTKALRGPKVWTNPAADADWKEFVDESPGAYGSVVALPVSVDGKIQGLLYLDRPVSGGDRLGFNKEALAVAASYMEVLRSPIMDAAQSSLGPRRSSDALWEEAFENVITESDAMFKVLSLSAKVAPSPYTVLFTGETGTGKGLLAYSLHRMSPRGEDAFVSVNCAAIPETLLESELFGHVKGSFTGADRDRLGLIRQAHGGTLFLDEVGKMSLPMQAKLLHFLDNKEVRPVGGSEETQVDVRILCASKRNLKAMVEEDLFLEDLYYRLLDFPIEVPPLRDRADDILLLARHYVQRAADELGCELPTMTRSFAAALRAFAWPGNVRELEKTIKRAVILSSGDDRLRLRYLPEEWRLSPSEGDADQVEAPVRPLKEQVAEFEGILLQRALESSGWNRSAAARQLKISYPTLLQKIKLYGLKAT